MVWKSLIFSKYVVWAYVLVVMLLAVLPLNSGGSLNNITLIRIRGDYWVHAVQFLPFAVLVRIGYRGGFLRALLAGVVLALAAEGIQYFISWRAYNVNDLLANMVGVVAVLFYNYQDIQTHYLPISKTICIFAQTFIYA